MALKAVHVSDVPNLDQVPENPSFSLYSTRFSKGNYIIPIYLNTRTKSGCNKTNNLYFCNACDEASNKNT